MNYSDAVIELINKLSYVEQKKFAGNDGVEIGMFQRMEEREYIDIVEL